MNILFLLIAGWYIKDIKTSIKLTGEGPTEVKDTVTVDYGNESHNKVSRFLPAEFDGHPTDIHIKKLRLLIFTIPQAELNYLRVCMKGLDLRI